MVMIKISDHMLSMLIILQAFAWVDILDPGLFWGKGFSCADIFVATAKASEGFSCAEIFVAMAKAMQMSSMLHDRMHSVECKWFLTWSKHFEFVRSYSFRRKVKLTKWRWRKCSVGVKLTMEKVQRTTLRAFFLSPICVALACGESRMRNSWVRNSESYGTVHSILIIDRKSVV